MTRRQHEHHHHAAGELMEIFPYADEAPLPDTEDVRGW